MSVSEAQKRATLKWQKEKTDEVRFRVPKGERARIQAHAEQRRVRYCFYQARHSRGDGAG